ncbi:DUF2182 domain-containing protein, partial [candidate division KSB1 bacterium]|nr:DUF2182 domain-containing protein [candidate division KSB1 bacterium]
VFSIGATVAQFALDQAALLSPRLVSTSPALGALLLVAAGLYQFTPLKTVCLDHCRSPVHFISEHWRPGSVGAFRMGIEHGAYCLGCCWVLMGLLFFGGVMNLLWIAAITGFLAYPHESSIGPLLANLKSLQKKKRKLYREWVWTRFALETLTGKSFREDVSSWLKWWLAIFIPCRR